MAQRLSTKTCSTATGGTRRLSLTGICLVNCINTPAFAPPTIEVKTNHFDIYGPKPVSIDLFGGKIGFVMDG